MRPAAAAVAASLLAAACGGGGGGATVEVSAAASLADAFAAIEAAFEDANPGTDVVLNLAGSSALREQLLDGAPADVFAPASLRDMEGVADDAEAFATNSMVIAVPAGNPGDVAGLADLARDDLLVGLCAPEVPCGRLARQALDDAGVDAAPDTEEPDVRSLLLKVEADELDAAIVYRTDALAAGDAVEVVGDAGAATTYPIAALDDDGDAFVAFVLGDEGRAILAAAGFGPP